MDMIYHGTFKHGLHFTTVFTSQCSLDNLQVFPSDFEVLMKLLLTYTDLW